MESVLDDIDDENWDEVRKQLKKNRGVFLSGEFDDFGFNVFHRACGHPDVPADIIMRMVMIDKNNLTKRTKHEWKQTPLHIACDRGSAATVRTLLALRSEKVLNDDGLGGYARKKDAVGCSPLTTVWASQLDRSWDRSWELDSAGLSEDYVSDLLRHLDQVSAVGDLNEIARDMWDKTLALLIAIYTGSASPTSSYNQWTALHSIAETGDQCPVVVLWLGLKIYPYQLKWADEQGDLPLHVAANHWETHQRNIARTDKFSFDDPLVRDILMKADGRTEMQMLVESYPEAASVCRLEDGRLPLHLAADSGCMWEGEIEAILKPCPKAIDARDPVTHLYPFMLRAAEDDSDSPESLNVIYMLLRKNPNNVKGGIRNSAYENYLEKKLNEKNDDLKRNIAEHELELRELRSKLKKHKAES